MRSGELSRTFDGAVPPPDDAQAGTYNSRNAVAAAVAKARRTGTSIAVDRTRATDTIARRSRHGNETLLREVSPVRAGRAHPLYDRVLVTTMLPSMANDCLKVSIRVRVREFIAAVFTLVTALFAPVNLGAQTASVMGIIADSAGVPIAGAEVTVKGAAASAITGDHGEFKINGLLAGNTVVRARRLGFRPDSVSMLAADAAGPPVTLRLSRVAAQLAPVLVKSRRIEYRGRLAGYYERLDRQSGGYFITRAEIDKQNPRTLSQLLQRAPGMSQFRGRVGLSGVRMRGRQCWPLVWLDGMQMSAGEFDLDGIPPNTLHGIELYLGSTTAPMRYTGGRNASSCGTILLWSRGPDTDPIQSRRGPRVSLEALVAAVQVYTADQVDERARVNPSKHVEVEYPPALFAEHVPGQVIAEFVVDPTGHVELETFGVVSSTNQLFSDAVRRAVEEMLYAPAKLGGTPVRQLVHQPFTFTPPKKPSTD